MRQVELAAPGEVRVLGDAAVPEVPADGVLLRIGLAGICGSDVHAYHGRHPFIRLPVRPGHELVATVSAVGSAVHGIAVGDRVVVEPSLVCGECRNCRSGRYNVCDRLLVIGCQAPGGMADYLAVPAAKVVPVPDGLADEAAVLAEPLAVAVHAAHVGRIAAGEDVVILGAGTIGLLCLQVARALGAGSVVVSDPSAERRALALQLGADAVLDPGEAPLGAVLAGAADVVLECVGVAPTVRDAVQVARKGARIVLVGVFSGEVPVDVSLVQDRELELLGTLMYTRADFAEALDLLARGAVAVDTLITHRFPLEAAAEAYRVADAGGTALKVILEVGA
ncbi:MAG TPA: alcohol dehydrogenase catalytic domain-containing protein [Solirubrobacter sp.]|nr:alcohol dehydrogenase catalytic domain-containing protein [Solirubrobacter sp.]